MKSGCHLEKGFTLIELLVVISIIGILAALLLVVLSQAKAHAHCSSCQNHLHEMGLALQMYVDEHQSRYPYYRGIPDPTYDDAVGADNTAFWWAKLLPYYPIKWTDPAYHCPGYNGAIKGRLWTDVVGPTLLAAMPTMPKESWLEVGLRPMDSLWGWEEGCLTLRTRVRHSG